jgi:hypothetical protein
MLPHVLWLTSKLRFFFKEWLYSRTLKTRMWVFGRAKDMFNIASSFQIDTKETISIENLPYKFKKESVKKFSCV